MTRNEMSDVIREAYRRALNSKGMRFVVYADSKGYAYIFEGIAGESNEPESAWIGKDIFICEFCEKYSSIGDIDENFRENLIEFLDEEQRSELQRRELEGNKLCGYDIRDLFPDAFEKYYEEIIDCLVNEIDTDEYLERAGF